MLDFTGILSGYESINFWKEKCIGTDKWLYSFRDSYKDSKEKCDWLRLIKTFARANLLEDLTYKKVMSVLRRAKKARTGSGDWRIIRMNSFYSEILQELELIPKPKVFRREGQGDLRDRTSISS